jgi:hypothetical protein
MRHDFDCPSTQCRGAADESAVHGNQHGVHVWRFRFEFEPDRALPKQSLDLIIGVDCNRTYPGEVDLTCGESVSIEGPEQDLQLSFVSGLHGR